MNRGSGASRHVARSPFSGTDTSQIWGKTRGKLVFQCSQTGALFFDRRDLQNEDYQQYYPYLAAFDQRRFAWELRIRRRKYERQLDLMGAYVSGRQLLDIGAGPGYFVRVALDCGWDARGVEVAEEAICHGRQEFGIPYTDIDSVADGQTDVVTCHHVFEHLQHPMEFLSIVHRKLRPGGLLVLHVPHQQPLTFAIRERWRRVLRSDMDRFCCLYGDIHISGFTERSLCSLVERHGFQALFTRTAGMWSKFYDPFFVRNYVRVGGWRALFRKLVRHSIETIGIPFGLGDWVIAYFRRT